MSPLALTVSFATGGSSGGGPVEVTVTLAVTGAEALPAVSVAIKLTV